MTGDREVKSAPSRPAWDERTEALMQEWHNRAAAAQHAHYLLAHRLRHRNLALGIPAVIFSSVVGTSVFATLSRDHVGTGLRVLVGSISVLAAVAAALQTFLRFPERAAQHVTAADWYAAIRRDAEQLLALPRPARGAVKPALDAMRTQMNRAGQNAPEIGDPLWLKVSAHFHVDADAIAPLPEQRRRPRETGKRETGKSAPRH